MGSRFPSVALGGGRGGTRGNWVEVSGAGLDFQNLAAGAEGGFLSRDCLPRAGAGGVLERSLGRMGLGSCGETALRLSRRSRISTAWGNLGG